MSIHISIDDELLRKAMEVSGSQTEKAVVEQAMREYVGNRTRKDLRDLLAQPLFADGYDYAAHRKGQ